MVLKLKLFVRVRKLENEKEEVEPAYVRLRFELQIFNELFRIRIIHYRE